MINAKDKIVLLNKRKFASVLVYYKNVKSASKCYESHANKYYSSHIVLHKTIKKKRFVNQIKIIKIT